MKIKAIDGSKQIYEENGALSKEITSFEEINFETERGVSAKAYNSNAVKTVKPTETTIFFEEKEYNKDNKQKYLIDDVISKNKKMTYAAVKNIEGNLTAAGKEDVIQNNYTKADSGVFVYNGLSSELHQKDVIDGATKSTEGEIVIKKASGSRPKELKRDEYSIFSDNKEKTESDNSYYNRGISANLFSGILEEEGGKYWNQVGQQITNSFKNSILNYVKPWEEYNFFSEDFWKGTAKSETTRTANAFGKIRSLRELEEYNLQYNWDDKNTDDDRFKLQYIPLNEQLSGFTTRTLNPSINVVGSMNADHRGPLASPSYISSIDVNNADSQWGRYGIMSANAGIGIANQFINNLGLSSTAELISGVVRGANSEDFLEGFGDVVTSVSMTAAEVLQLNAATAQNFYTSKPGTYIKYGKASHNEIANIHMFPNAPNRGDYESSYKKLNIGSVRLAQMTRLGTYGFLRNLMADYDGIPFYANDENFRFNSTTNSWGTESVSTNQTLFGVSSNSSSAEVAEMIASLMNKNNTYKELGRIYIKINPTLKISSPQEIPFEFTPIINENANVAKYQSESLLGRIGAWHMYTGTDLGGITLTTTYMPLAPDSLDERENANKNKQFGLDNWQYYWTQNRINQIELLYRSLVLPTYGKDLIKPPIIEIELGEKNSNSLDNFFKHPIGGLEEVQNNNQEEGAVNSLTYSEESKKYLKYTKYFNKSEEGYKRIRKSYIVTSCQFLPISEEGYYNMYGAYRSNYNKSLSTTLEQKNRSFHTVESNDGKGWLYGVTSRGFKVTIQCLEIKENIMDLYPDFKYYYDSVNSLEKNFTAVGPATDKLTNEQIEAISNMGIEYLGSNSQAQLKMLLDNVLKRFKAKSVAGNIKNKVWKISRFFYNNTPSFYKNFGTSENTNETGTGGSNYEYNDSGKIGGRDVLDFKNDNHFRSFNEFASQNTNGKKTLKEIMKAANSKMLDSEYKNFFQYEPDVELIPSSDSKYFSTESESNIKAMFAVKGVGSKVRGGNGEGCIVYELDKKVKEEGDLKDFFENANGELNNIKNNIETAFPDFVDSYSDPGSFMTVLKKRVASSEVSEIQISTKAINEYTPEKPAEGEEAKEDDIQKQIKDYEQDLHITRTKVSLDELGNLLDKEKQGGDFRIEGVLGHFKNTNRKSSALQVVNTALKTVDNNIDVLNGKGRKAFQAISISGETALFTNMLKPITVSFQKTFISGEDNSKKFTKKYAMTLKIKIKETNIYKAEVINISDVISSTYQSLIASSKLAVIKYLQEDVCGNNKQLKEVGENVVTIVNKLNNNSTIEEIDGAIQTLQSFCNPDQANKEIVNNLGGKCGNELFNNYPGAQPEWKESNISKDVSILKSYTLKGEGQTGGTAALSNIEYNEATETFQSSPSKSMGNNDAASDIKASEWENLKSAIESGNGTGNKPTIYSVVEKIYNEQLEIEKIGRLQGLNLK